MKRLTQWFAEFFSPEPVSHRFIVGSEHLVEVDPQIFQPEQPLMVTRMTTRPTPVVDAFLHDFAQLCQDYGLSLTHEDDGAFVVDVYRPQHVHFVNLAHITPDVLG